VTDTVLILAWLIFAHLVADFVLQNDWIAINKATGGRTGWLALGLHGFHVGLCLVPVVLAFGLPGIVYLVLVVVTHMIVDSWKVQATRQAEAAGREQARARIARTGATAESGLGSAWTPWPGLLFLADQALHLTFALVGWLVILQGVALLPQFLDFVNRVLGSWDRATVHAVVLTGIVVLSLFIVNTRGAYYFILALVSPRELPPDERAGAAAVGAGVEPDLAATVDPPAADTPVAVASSSTAPVATVAPAAATIAPTVRETPGGAVPAPSVAVPSGAPAKIGATIGALERLLIVAFILVGAEAAVGFVIAAKTLARFKQLDDRGFAEYYLLGTLASVSVAVFTALVAQAALQTIP
jgi:uncharacterized protein DUF3307